MPGEQSSNRFPDKITVYDVLPEEVFEYSKLALAEYRGFIPNLAENEADAYIDEYTDIHEDNRNKIVNIAVDAVSLAAPAPVGAGISVIDMIYNALTIENPGSYEDFVKRKMAEEEIIESTPSPTELYRTLGIEIDSSSYLEQPLAAYDNISSELYGLKMFYYEDGEAFINLGNMLRYKNVDVTTGKYNDGLLLMNRMTKEQQALATYAVTLSENLGINYFAALTLMEEGNDYYIKRYIEKHIPLYKNAEYNKERKETQDKTINNLTEKREKGADISDEMFEMWYDAFLGDNWDSATRLFQIFRKQDQTSTKIFLESEAGQKYSENILKKERETQAIDNAKVSMQTQMANAYFNSLAKASQAKQTQSSPVTASFRAAETISMQNLKASQTKIAQAKAAATAAKQSIVVSSKKQSVSAVKSIKPVKTVTSLFNSLSSKLARGI